MNPEELQGIVEREEGERARVRHRVCVCSAAGCMSLGAEGVRAALKRTLAEAHLEDEVQLSGTGCLGLCHAGALVQVESGPPEAPARTLYQGVDEAAAVDIVRQHLVEGRPLSGRAVPADAPFFAHQHRVVLENAGRVDPESIESGHRRRGLGRAAARAGRAHAGGGAGRGDGERAARPRRRRLPHRPQVGHRGQGARRRKKYVVVQRRRGRSRRLHGPHGAGGRSAPRAGGHGHRRLRRGRRAGLRLRARRSTRSPSSGCRRPSSRRSGAACSATRIFETSFNFRVDIRIGAGRLRLRRRDGAAWPRSRGSAASRGRGRPTRPQTGLWGQPTLINNVETFANIAPIIRNGGGLVRRHRHREEQGHQDLRAGRQDRQHRPDRGADGHHAARDRLRHRRRHPGRQGLQGGADRRPLRRLHPGRAPRHAGRLRVAAAGGLHHGLGRPDRHGRDLAAWWTWPGSSWSSAWTRAAASACPAASAPCRCTEILERITDGRGVEADLDMLEELCRPGAGDQPVRPGPDGAQPGVSARCATSATSTRRTCASAAARPASAASSARPGRWRHEPGRPARRPWRRQHHLHHQRRAGHRPRGETLLEACREQRRRDPHPLPPRRPAPTSAPAGCAWWRWRARPRLVPACVTPVAEGMVVRTDSERLRRYRRMILELLFAERNHVCAVCVVNGHCELQDLAVEVGMDHVRFDYQFPRTQMDATPRALRASTTTAASCARAACASATRSRARTPGTSRAAAARAASSPT